MASIADLIDRSGLKATQIIIGLVVETTGIVTQVPGYDFKLTIHIVSKDENVISRHNVIVPSNGQTLAEFRLDYIGRYVLTVQDEQGRAISPIRGRCVWWEKRNVLISPFSEFEIKCRARNEVVSHIYGMFNDKERKRLTLPMPPMGWRIAILSFVTKRGEYNIVVDGVKEQPLIRSSTAHSRNSHRPRHNDYVRPSSAISGSRYRDMI